MSLIRVWIESRVGRAPRRIFQIKSLSLGIIGMFHMNVQSA
ncbi:hypothetical protein LINGRAHAP2_LOCUS6392, partial [Linum grandiflorum]